MEAVLGISLGTRSIGMAIVRDKKLIDWHRRSFNARWSDDKLKLIIQFIEREIERNGISMVGIKIPDVLPVSKGFMQLVGGINRLFEARGMGARYFTLSELKAHFCPARKIDKGTLARCVLQKYPDLYLVYYSGDTRKSLYYASLFEAAAAASMVLRTK